MTASALMLLTIAGLAALFAAATVGTGLGAAWLSLEQKSHGQFEAAAAALGLTARRRRREMQGILRGFAVRVQRTQVNNSRQTVLEVHGLPTQLSLATETWASQAGLSGPDLRTGDARFDARILVQGDKQVATALLDNDTRQLANHLIRRIGKTELDNGVLRTVTGLDVDDPDLRPLLHRLLDLAEALHGGGASVERRLLLNFQHDPNPTVRINNLRLLLRVQSREGDAAARIALTHANVRVRLLAARYLGPDGYSMLHATAANDNYRASVRCDAINALVDWKANDPTTHDVIRRLLRDDEPTVRLSATRAAGKLQFRDLAGKVLRIAESRLERHTGTSGRTARRHRVVIRSLGRIGKDCDDVLLRFVKHHDHDVKLDALTALGQVGTLAAVEGLLPVARSTALLPAAAKVQRRAKLAIRQIQERHGGAERGALSLAAPDDGGQLAIVPDVGGELSLKK